MHKKEFQQFDLKKKVHLLLEQGKQVSSRQFLYYTIKLYTVSDFFAEIWYIPFSNKIDKVELLEIDELLHLYRHDFDISSLLK